MTGDEITLAVARFKLMMPEQRKSVLESVEHSARFETNRDLRNNAVALLPHLQAAEKELQQQFRDMEQRITDAVLKSIKNTAVNDSAVEQQPMIYPVINYAPFVKPAVIISGIGIGVWFFGLPVILGGSIGVGALYLIFLTLMNKPTRTMTRNAATNKMAASGGNTYNNGAIHIESNQGNITIIQNFNNNSHDEI